MAAEPILVPVAFCEVCWLIDHTSWEPESMDEAGKVIMRLVGVDIPQKHNTDTVDICCMCGGITVVGIYEMRDPTTVVYLDKNDVEEDPTSFTFSISPRGDDDEDDDYEGFYEG